MREDNDKCASIDCQNLTWPDSGIYCWDCIQRIQRRIRRQRKLAVTLREGR